MCVCVCVGGVCVCVHVRAHASLRVCMRVRVRVCAFMLYALNFDNMYLQRTCKRLGPVRIWRSKCSLLLILPSLCLSPSTGG